MDYLHKESDLTHLLLLNDDLSEFTWMFPSVSATAAEAIARWKSTFGAITWIVYAQGPHSFYQMIKEVISTMLVKHHFTTTYSSWANGTIARLCDELLCA